MDLVKPDIASCVCAMQFKQKTSCEKRLKQRTFSRGDPVFASHGISKLDQHGYHVSSLIVEGLLSFQVRLEVGQIVCRHIDHVCRRNVDTSSLPDISMEFNFPDISIPEDSHGDNNPHTLNLRYNIPPICITLLIVTHLIFTKGKDCSELG